MKRRDGTEITKEEESELRNELSITLYTMIPGAIASFEHHFNVRLTNKEIVSFIREFTDDLVRE